MSQAKSGAIAVKDNRILATGYNGPPAGLEHCDTTGCIREQLKVPSGMRPEICRANHSEWNIITQAATNGIDLTGATLYCTTHPCVICAKLLISCKFAKIYYREDYPDELSKALLAEAGIQMIQFTE